MATFCLSNWNLRLSLVAFRVAHEQQVPRTGQEWGSE
jgi:hypothetical protein